MNIIAQNKEFYYIQEKDTLLIGRKTGLSQKIPQGFKERKAFSLLAYDKFKGETPTAYYMHTEHTGTIVCVLKDSPMGIFITQHVIPLMTMEG